uniref:CCHC-type domain-containing protein n=1 Tax=Brassica oleracea var. oleracea TaxID=109376 RepID=A0A0D2ZV94_BRAOL
MECYLCHKKGHMKKDCWKLKNKQQGNQEEKVDRVTVTEDQFLILLEGDAINVACQDTSWVIDSRATTHATSQRNLFSTYTTGEKSSSFYWMQAKVSKDAVNAVENDGVMELWHKRLGHMSEKGMFVLSKNEVIPRISSLHLQKCSHCFAGKQHRVSFNSSAPSKKPE